MIYGTVELTSGEKIRIHYEYHPVVIGQVFHLDAAGDFRQYRVTRLLDAKPHHYIRCDNGLEQAMPIYAYESIEIIDETADLDGCSTCGRDLDEDAHGDQCLACWIDDKGAECADADYDLSVEEVA